MAARRTPAGLTSPRVENAELQRFLEQISQRVNGLSTELGDRVPGGGGGGTTSGSTPAPTPGTGGGFLPDLPVLAVPLKPFGVEVFCGIGICILSWENPFRVYANHARTIVYRGTTDRFDESAPIGQAAYMVFVDDTGLEDNTTYYYWIRWVNTEDVEGPLSDVVSSTTGLDPEAVYDEIVAWLESSPLLEALQSDILDPEFILEEIRRISASITLLSASAAQAADEAAALAKTAADTAQTTADTAQNAADAAQNTATTAAGQALTALNSANASQMTANEALAEAMELLADIGTLQRADRVIVQINGQGRNTRFATDVVAGADIELGTHATDTTDDITVEVYTVTATDLGSNVWTYDLLLEPGLIDWTMDQWIRSSGADFTLTLVGRQDGPTDISNDEDWWLAQNVARFPLQFQITELEASLDDKATVAALNALITRVTENADTLTAQAAQITSLEARLTGTSLGPETNEFTGTDRTAAEAARDTYFAANPTKLAQYDANDELNIRLTFGVLRVFQHRVGNAWVDNGEVEPTAAAISSLNAQVQMNMQNITANASSLTALMTTVAGKANASDLAAKADANALRVLTNRVTANEQTISANQENIIILEAVLDGVQLGPPANTFTGDTRAAAVSARDSWFSANATVLGEYDADDDLHIRLLYGTNTQYQNRQSSAWVDVDADPRASGAALAALSNRVTQTEGGISTIQSEITTLQGTVAGKADTSALAALMTGIQTNGDAIEANAEAITALRVSVGGFEPGQLINEFTGTDRADAESIRDAYGTANAPWLMDYNENPKNYIILQYD